MVLEMDKKQTPDFRLFFIPPLAVYKVLKDSFDKSSKNHCLLLQAWVTSLWIFLIIFASDDIVLNYFIASLTLLYMLGCMIAFATKDGNNDIESSTTLKTMIIGEVFILCLLLGQHVSGSYSEVNISLIPSFVSLTSIITNSIYTVFMLLWGVFMIKDKYEIFSLFPRYSLSGEYGTDVEIQVLRPKYLWNMFFVHALLIFMFLIY
jgi:hypothetical protein